MIRRLTRGGFDKDFVRQAILPDWWDKECEKDPALTTDVEIRVARFLELPVSAVRALSTKLTPPSYAGAQLRRVRPVDEERLTPAIHAAMQIAAAVVRNLRHDAPSVELPPLSGLEWRELLQKRRDPANPLGLEEIIGDLWTRGIPVVPAELLPTPSFQGMACVVDGRPVILLGHRHDAPGRVAVFIAHEVGHIVSGHCSPDHPVLDEDEELVDDAEIELVAERYATDTLVGEAEIPEVKASDFRELAKQAVRIAQPLGIDPGAVIFQWARRSKDYSMASLAVRALYLAVGARKLLREYFERHVDWEGAPESDRGLLRCVLADRD